MLPMIPQSTYLRMVKKMYGICPRCLAYRLPNKARYGLPYGAVKPKVALDSVLNRPMGTVCNVPEELLIICQVHDVFDDHRAYITSSRIVGGKAAREVVRLVVLSVEKGLQVCKRVFGDAVSLTNALWHALVPFPPKPVVGENMGELGRSSELSVQS